MRRHLIGRSPADVRGFAIGFLSLLNDQRIAIPAGYGLLVKALVTVEGVARAIYPGIDVAEAAKPYATRLIAARLASPERLWERTPAAARAALRELLA
jgi:ubiquinone biosynthesis protein